MEALKILMITGSRGWTDRDKIVEVLSNLRIDEWHVIHGGARGVDTMAGEIAEDLGFEVQVYPAKWDEHGRAAGFIRNDEMARVADACIAFWDGQSRGTRHAITACQKRGIPTRVFHLPISCPEAASRDEKVSRQAANPVLD